MKRKNGKIDRYFKGRLKRIHIGSKVRMGRCSAGAAEHNQEDEHPHQFSTSSKRSRRRVPTSPSSVQNRVRRKESLYFSIFCSLSSLLLVSVSCRTNAPRCAPQNITRSASNQCRTVCSKVEPFSRLPPRGELGIE